MARMNFKDGFNIKNMSLVQFIIYTTIIAIIIVTILSSIIITIMEYVQNSIWCTYLDDYKVDGGVFKEARLMNLDNEVIFVLKILKVIEIILLIIIFVSAVISEAFIVYNLKIKKPLKLLLVASDKISDNDINFEIPIISNDEMGRLCIAFEKMRASLENNYTQIWNQIEDRKKLNSAFSHDLRTPLTVLKGYMELLINYVPEDKLEKDKLIDVIKTMNSHVNRLESYIDNMSMLLKLEDVLICPQVTSLGSLVNDIKKTGLILLQNNNITYYFNSNIVDNIKVKIDSNIVLEVYDNLISNAAKFAKTKIECEVYIEKNYFVIEVRDDGFGFSQEDIKNVVKPFYKCNNNTKKDGFGLGLNICDILCHKHGGYLYINNNANIGAVIRANFYISIDNM